MRAVILLGVLVVGCASASAQRLPSGYIGITCKRSSLNCHEKAGEVCRYGYDVVGQDGRSGVIATSVAAVPYYKGELVVQCRRGPAAEDEQLAER